MSTVELIEYVGTLFASWGYLVVFLSSFIEITPLGFLIPGGHVLAIGGFFSYDRGVSLSRLIIFGTLGAWITFLGAYLLGKRTGLTLVKKLKQEKNAEKARQLLEHHGGKILRSEE